MRRCRSAAGLGVLGSQRRTVARDWNSTGFDIHHHGPLAAGRLAGHILSAPQPHRLCGPRRQRCARASPTATTGVCISTTGAAAVALDVARRPAPRGPLTHIPSVRRQEHPLQRHLLRRPLHPAPPALTPANQSVHLASRLRFSRPQGLSRSRDRSRAARKGGSSRYPGLENVCANKGHPSPCPADGKHHLAHDGPRPQEEEGGRGSGSCCCCRQSSSQVFSQITSSITSLCRSGRSHFPVPAPSAIFSARRAREEDRQGQGQSPCRWL